MSSELLKLLSRPAPLKCDRCKGAGIVTVTHPRLWSPEVCWCSACGGTGRAHGDGKGGAE